MVEQEKWMGRFSVEVELSNDADEVLAEAGNIPAAKVRRIVVLGLVDSGATRLIIPKKVADQLGLKTVSEATVRYADGHTATRPIVERLRLAYGGRQSVFNAIVEPNRDELLIGAIVLEDLDFLVDCGAQRLVPRNPEHIISEAE